MKRDRKSDVPQIRPIELSDNLAGFPQATITQLEEALEERVESRRTDAADTYPMNLDRRENDRRRKKVLRDLWLCAGD